MCFTDKDMASRFPPVIQQNWRVRKLPITTWDPCIYCTTEHLSHDLRIQSYFSKLMKIQEDGKSIISSMMYVARSISLKETSDSRSLPMKRSTSISFVRRHCSLNLRMSWITSWDAHKWCLVLKSDSVFHTKSTNQVSISTEESTTITLKFRFQI